MSWARRVLAHFGIVRGTQTRRELVATEREHRRVLRETDAMLRDYELGDKVLLLRVAKKR